jgi:hypothetical protein
VKHVDPPRSDIPITNWQILGQLKIRAGSTPDGTIKAWLMNSLNALSLPDDLVSRLLASIEVATTPILRPDRIQAQPEYLEIVVLAPAEQTAKEHLWGFFRVERASSDSRIENAKGRCIEYYLYLDKRTSK